MHTHLHDTKANVYRTTNNLTWAHTWCELITTMLVPLLRLLWPWRHGSWLLRVTLIRWIPASTQARYPVACALWIRLSTGRPVVVHARRLPKHVGKFVGRRWYLAHHITCWLRSGLDGDISSDGPVNVRFQIRPWQQSANIKTSKNYVKRIIVYPMTDPQIT